MEVSLVCTAARQRKGIQNNGIFQVEKNPESDCTISQTSRTLQDDNSRLGITSRQIEISIHFKIK